MNREGVVQRRTARVGTGERPVEISSGPADVEDRRTSNETDDMDDLDSKETRLTLMEEVLLLGLKDKEVNPMLLLSQSCHSISIEFICRDILPSGTIAYLVVFVGVY